MDNQTANPATHKDGSLAKGILGIYEFNITNIIKEAWHRLHGIKATYWKAVILSLLIFAAIILGVFLIVISFDLIAAHWFNATKETIITYNKILIYVLQVLGMFLYVPLATGILMIGVKRSVDEPMSATHIFHYYRYWKKLWVLPFIMFLLEVAMDLTQVYWWAQIIITLIYLYFTISYFMYYPLIAEKNLSVWEALETSRKTISHHWFKMLWFFILFSLILLASLLTVGIALIWTLPLLNNAIGILYREMFGVEKVSSQEIYI